MPAPPPSVSPRVGAQFIPHPKIDSSRPEQLTMAAHQDTFSFWRKTVDGLASRPTPPPTRSILAPLHPNTNPSQPNRSVSKPSTRVSSVNSIPRPATTPDVFASNPGTSLPSRLTTFSNLSGKRPNESASMSAPKRLKADEKRELHEASATNYKMEEEKWTAKWLKMFPTLVFHFETGADEGQRRALAARVVKMGAVSLIQHL